MRNFIILWLGQIVSTIGSQMTNFAVRVWVWELTGSATALSLIGLAILIPRVISSLYAGIIVDRYSRKVLMMLGDSVAAVSTAVLALLYFHDQLQIWHLYVTGAVNSCFGQLQNLSYSSSIATLVPKEQYTRATSMGSFFHYGSAIIAPAIAGALYPLISLAGILSIDLMTFLVGIITLAFISIPRVKTTQKTDQKKESITEQLSFGFRYLKQYPPLIALLATTSVFWLIHDMGGAIFAPLILARTDNNTQLLGQIFSAAGIGGVLGGTIISIWGGPKKKIKALLCGMMGAGVAKTIFGLATTPLIWIPAQFSSSLNFPLISSTNASIWIEKIPSDIQGRIFSVRMLARQLVSAIALGSAGLLADHIFIPAMQANGRVASIFSPIFGTGEGAGLALFYVMTTIGLFLIGLISWRLPYLSQIKD
jgi:MFS family permease